MEKRWEKIHHEFASNRSRKGMHEKRQQENLHPIVAGKGENVNSDETRDDVSTTRVLHDCLQKSHEYSQSRQ
jgi:hypothetical protein